MAAENPTNERDSVMVRYVTYCENSNDGKKRVRMCHHFPLFLDSGKSRSLGTVWTDRSRVECLALIDLRGLECVHVWVPEDREDMIFFLSFFRVCWRGWGLERASLSRSLPSPAPSHRGVTHSRSQNWKLIQSPLNGASLNWVFRT